MVASINTAESVSTASYDVTLSEFVRRMNSLRNTYIKVSPYLVLQVFQAKILVYLINYVY
jgi:hypothetical protein